MVNEILRRNFERRVIRGPGCWGWKSKPMTHGYVRLKASGRLYKGHRASWELHRGPIPAGLFVCHHCDNRGCVNPDHLFLGTAKDNLDDMWAKGRGYGATGYRKPPGPGRTRRGAEISWAKLTPEAVVQIRRRAMTYAAYAKLFGVSKAAIAKVTQGRSWGSVS